MPSSQESTPELLQTARTAPAAPAAARAAAAAAPGAASGSMRPPPAREPLRCVSCLLQLRWMVDAVCVYGGGGALSRAAPALRLWYAPALVTPSTSLQRLLGMHAGPSPCRPQQLRRTRLSPHSSSSSSRRRRRQCPRLHSSSSSNSRPRHSSRRSSSHGRMRRRCMCAMCATPSWSVWGGAAAAKCSR